MATAYSAEKSRSHAGTSLKWQVFDTMKTAMQCRENIDVNPMAPNLLYKRGDLVYSLVESETV